MKKQIAIIMGSDSDLSIMSEAAKILDEFKIGYMLSIVSAHRTPDCVNAFAKACEKSAISVIIAGAGGAAHLPGMTAASTYLPVIGVPIQTKTAEGLDSLLSIAQMPPGIPVATVSINGSQNAALLALQIIATSDKKLAQKIKNYKKSMKNNVLKKAIKLERIGYEKYLNLLKVDKK